MKPITKALTNIANDINSKGKNFQPFGMNSKQDYFTTFADIEKIEDAVKAYKGDLILSFAGEYHDNNVKLAIKDLADNTNQTIQGLEYCITKNTTRKSGEAKALAELKKKQDEANTLADNQAIAKEAKRIQDLKDIADLKEDKRIQDRLDEIDEEREELEQNIAKIEGVSEKFANANDRVIHALGGDTTTMEEKIDIMSQVSEKPTAQEVEHTKKRYIEFADLTDQEHTIYQDLVTKHPTMAEWLSPKAVLASKIGGLIGNTAHREVANLTNPTAQEVTTLRAEILSNQADINAEADRVAERDDLGCKIALKNTQAYKDETKATNQEVKIRREDTQRAIAETEYPLPTERLTIAKGKVKANDREAIITMMKCNGLTEDNILNFVKAFVDTKLKSKLVAKK